MMNRKDGKGRWLCARDVPIQVRWPYWVPTARIPDPDHNCIQWPYVQLGFCISLLWSSSCRWSSLGCPFDKSSSKLLILRTVFHWLPFLHWALTLGSCSGSWFDAYPFLASFPASLYFPILSRNTLPCGILQREHKLKQSTTNRSGHSSKHILF